MLESTFKPLRAEFCLFHFVQVHAVPIYTVAIGLYTVFRWAFVDN